MCEKMALIVKKNEGMESMLKEAVKALKTGKIAVYPTESSYGVGCSIEFSEKIKEIYSLKGRNPKKPLPVIAGSAEIMEKYAFLGGDERKLISAFMPGPLTLVAEKKESVPCELSEKGIAFRIPEHEFARKMALGVSAPIVSTSANISGEKALCSVEGMELGLLKKVDIVIDYGILPERPASTVFHVGQKKVLRQGPIKEREILGVLEEKK